MYNHHLMSKKHQKKAEHHADRKQQDTPLIDASTAVDMMSDEPKVVVSASTGMPLPAHEQNCAVPLGHCLFCTHKSSSVEKCLKHMLNKHGFFVPYMHILRNLNGLLVYLGQKIGIGRMCLYCNGRGKLAYPSVHAAWQHMHSKGHCKLRFDDEEDIEEYYSFYDFPEFPYSDDDEETESDSVPQQNADNADAPTAMITDQDAKQSRSHVHVAESGELVLKDGTVLGHRSMKHIYKQSLKPESAESTTISRLMREYRTLQMPGYHAKSTQSDIPKAVMRNINRVRMQRGIQESQLNRKYFRAQVDF
jgi:pre-60S factor REI1